MRIAFVGSRGFVDRTLVSETVFDYFMCIYRGTNPIFVSGGSSLKDSQGKETSVDKIAEDEIDRINSDYCGQKIEKKIFYADWKTHGKKAGFMRNILIVENADLIVALWDGKSNGTKHTIDLAIKAGKPIDVYIR